MPLRLILALALSLFVALPLHAQPVPAGATPSPNKEITPPTVPPTTPADIQPGSKPEGVPAPAASSSGPSEARVGKMRGRWSKMTPEQREEMRKKATRRLEERYERLSPQEQAQINGISAQIDKLSKEQRSIMLARIHQKAYQERQQKKLMKEQEDKAAEKPAAAAPAPAAAPAAPAGKPASP